MVRDIHASVAVAVLDDAIEALRTLDNRHFELIGEVHAEFFDHLRPHERDVVAKHRAEVAALVADCGALAIAGGHVDALAICLHLFNVAPALRGQPVVGWSAGAMVLADRIVLFNDRAPDGRAYAEVYGAGLGLCRNIVPLPHARRRLRLDDPLRIMVFARRFAPSHLVVLEHGARVDCGDGDCCPPGVRVLTTDGRVEVLAEVAA
jgi:cyanophycinase-like exopeptidase